MSLILTLTDTFDASYLGKAKQCELITQITFYNNNFGELSQIYRTTPCDKTTKLNFTVRRSQTIW